MDAKRDVNSDQLSIETPELVPIEIALAGIGSRFVALLLDSLIWLAAVAILSLALWFLRPALGAFSKLSAQWATAIYVFALFVLNWGYFTLFEAFWGGRTPGKRVAGIRVIHRSGRAIGFLESMARNLIRYIDQIPFCYAIGAIAIFTTRQHQRLGDLAAGTLVVRDEPNEAPLWADAAVHRVPELAAANHAQPTAARPGSVLPASALARLTSADLAVMESFFARRLDLPSAARQDLAQRIASAIQAKSGLEPPPGMPAEEFLERTAHQLRDGARLRLGAEPSERDGLR
ncbi:MAG: RDD family protein [Terracidiphilus sp.]